MKFTFLKTGRSIALSTMVALGCIPAASAQNALTIAIDPLITMDPAFARGTGQDLSILSQLYSSLTTFNPQGEVVGDLALEWSTKDAKEYTFKLRDGVKFADGEPLDAAAVVWNIERMKNPETKATANTDFNLIESATAVDPTTLVIKTTAPWVDLPKRMSWFFMLPPKWTESHNPKVDVNPSGAYNLVDYELSSHVTLKANPDYYGQAPGFKDVTYRVVPNTATRISALKSGEIQASLRIDAVDLDQLKSLPGYKVGAIGGRRVHVLRFNTNHEATGKLKVRQAINYAINKELITKTIYRGLTQPATTQVLNSADSGFNPELKAWPYDADKAKALLAEAGYPNGLELTIGVTGEAGFIQAVQATEAMSAQLAEVGVKLNIKTVPGNTFVSFLRDKENAPDMVYLGYVSSSNAQAELMGQFASTAPYTWGPVPAGYDEAVTAAKTAPDAAEQVKNVRLAAQIAADDAMVVYLWPQPQTYAVSDKVEWTIRADDWVKATDMKPAAAN